MKAIDRSRVASEETLIQQFRRGMKNIRQEVVVESSVCRTHRLCRS